jgi:tRNA (guanine-N7-)-methyltransferase
VRATTGPAPGLPAPDPGATRPPATVRTFHPRRGRIGRTRRDALDRLWERYGAPLVEPPAGTAAVVEESFTGVAPFDPVALFGRRAPIVLEIGPGMGEATVAMAAADPGRDWLAVEVHTPGIANLMSLAEAAGVTNLRVVAGDALTLAGTVLPPDSLDAVHVFFPDPWPKARHHKRRIIVPERVALLRSRLVPGGTLHAATDWPEYAESMLETLTADPELVNTCDGYAPRPAYRPLTKFERRGRDAGRPVHDLVFRRARQVG